jgi:hypothetical protein
LVSFAIKRILFRNEALYIAVRHRIATSVRAVFFAWLGRRECVVIFLDFAAVWEANVICLNRQLKAQTSIFNPTDGGALFCAP